MRYDVIKPARKRAVTTTRKKVLKYELRLKGLNSPSGTISLRALQAISNVLLEAAERGLRLAIEGNSVRPGRLPQWLSNSLELKCTGIRKGSTVLTIEAPLLGVTAKDEIRQQDLWYVVPKPEDTAFTLLSRSVHDTTAEELDSDTYDRGVLDSLLQFKPILRGYADGIELRCKTRPRENFQIREPELEKIQRLKAKIPEPRAYVISGYLDAIEHSKRRFHLVLSSGESIVGTIDSQFLSVEDMRQYWGKKATIKGIVHFRPSGKPRLIEAQVIKSMEDGEEVFGNLPQVQTEAAFLKETTETVVPTGWLKEVWGKWPGDEPIEKLLATLKENNAI
jgi:hypothetical protein